MENQRSRVFVPKKPVKRLTLKKNTVTIALDNKIKNVMELPEENKVKNVVEHMVLPEENKVKNVVEPEEFDLLRELPYEIFLKIMAYLSTSDILKKMAPVSKSYYQLSQDPNIIKQLEFKTNYGLYGLYWSDERKEKYYDDFFKVLKNCQKLKYLSVDLDGDLDQPITSWKVPEYFTTRPGRTPGKFFMNWIKASVNLQYLEEFYIQFRNFELESCIDFLQYGIFDQCPKLKILKIRRYRIKMGCWRSDDVNSDPFVNFEILDNTISKLNSKSLQNLHLYSPNTNYTKECDHQIMKNFLEMITENMPMIQNFLLYPCSFGFFLHSTVKKKICQEIEAKKKIKIEISYPANRTTNFVFSRI